MHIHVALTATVALYDAAVRRGDVQAKRYYGQAVRCLLGPSKAAGVLNEDTRSLPRARAVVEESMLDEDARIVEAMGMSPHAGRRLLLLLDARYQRHPERPEDVEAQMHASNLDAAPVRVGDVIPWAGQPRTVGKCEGADRCLACERRGWHLEPAQMVEAGVEATEDIQWGVWCVPTTSAAGRAPTWLPGNHLLGREANESAAAGMNREPRTAKYWRYEARPILPDGSPGQVP